MSPPILTEANARKSDGTLFTAAAQKMGLTVDECVVYEDAPYAAAGAKKAGFFICGIGQNAKDNSLGNINITDFTELL